MQPVRFAEWLPAELPTVPRLLAVLAREPGRLTVRVSSTKQAETTQAESLALMERWCQASLPREPSAVASHRAHPEPRAERLAPARPEASPPRAVWLMQAVRSMVPVRRVPSVAGARQQVASQPEVVAWGQPSALPEEEAEQPSAQRGAVGVEVQPWALPEEAAEQPSAQQVAAGVEVQLSEPQEAVAAQLSEPRPAAEAELVVARRPEVAAAAVQPSEEQVVEAEQPWAALVAEAARLWGARAVAAAARPSARRLAAAPLAAASACRRDQARQVQLVRRRSRAR